LIGERDEREDEVKEEGFACARVSNARQKFNARCKFNRAPTTMRAGKSKCPFIYAWARFCKIDSAGIINNNVPGEIDFRDNAFLNFDQ